MGAAAEAGADNVVVTDDNPRHEDGDVIVAGILGGLRVASAVEVIRGRGEAIRHALATARSGDIVLVAGKGHETQQQVGDELRPFSDRALVRRLLEATA